MFRADARLGPGWQASHGCVRLTNASMNRLWPHLGVGMPVETCR